MNALIDRLHSLEESKHAALLRFDSEAYEAATNAQLDLVRGQSPRTVQPGDLALLERLSRLIRLNASLVFNLLSVSPMYALGGNEYSRAGTPMNRTAHRVLARS